MAQTLEEQLDALIAEHGLSSISLTRIVCGDRNFWGVNAQGNGFCGSNGHDRGETPGEGLARAIEDLNTLRIMPVVVPELELAA